MYDNNILIEEGFTSGKHTKIEKGKCKNNKKNAFAIAVFEYGTVS